MEYKNKGAITSLEVQQHIAAGNVGGTAVLGAGKIAHLEAEVKQARVSWHILLNCMHKLFLSITTRYVLINHNMHTGYFYF